MSGVGQLAGRARSLLPNCAVIAAFEDAMYSQASPSVDVERRVAPVMAFVRLSDRKIRLRSQIYVG